MKVNQEKLPTVLEKFIEAMNAFDPEKVVNCFRTDARVSDEAKTHSGHAGIREWVKESTRQYRPRQEVLAWEDAGDEISLLMKVSGSFDGSPIELTFRFRMEGGRIASLSIGD